MGLEGQILPQSSFLFFIGTYSVAEGQVENDSGLSALWCIGKAGSNISFCTFKLSRLGFAHAKFVHPSHVLVLHLLDRGDISLSDRRDSSSKNLL